MRDEAIGLAVAVFLAALAFGFLASILGPQMVQCDRKHGVMVRAMTMGGYTCVRAEAAS